MNNLTYITDQKSVLEQHSGNVNSTPGNTDVVNNNNIRLATKIIGNFFTRASGLQDGLSRGQASTNATGGVKALASKPVFTNVGNKVVVNVFYYIPNKNQALSNNSVNSLGDVLSKIFKRPVEVRLVRLYYPYLNSHILAQYIAINSRKYNFTRIQRAIFGAVPLAKVDGDIFNNTSLPAYITGIKITISGRLTTQKSVPRQTEQSAQIGTFSKGKNIIEYSAFTSKNKKGAFTVKVWIGQVVPSYVT